MTGCTPKGSISKAFPGSSITISFFGTFSSFTARLSSSLAVALAMDASDHGIPSWPLSSGER